MKEYLLSLNEYNKPSVIEDEDALAVLLNRLLLMEPGTNPLHPEMGVDVVGRYRYAYDKDLDQLQEEITKQIEIYLSDYRLTEVLCQIVSGILRIEINIDDTLFAFSTADVIDGNDNAISLVQQQ